MPIEFTLSPERQTLQADARTFAREVLSGVKDAITSLPRPEDRFLATPEMRWLKILRSKTGKRPHPSDA